MTHLHHTLSASVFLFAIAVSNFVASPVHAEKVNVTAVKKRSTKHEGKQKKCGDVVVDIRTLKGEGHLEDGKKIRLEPRIKDLRKKLRKLTYAKYSLLTHKNEIIPLASKKVLKLGNGHRLALRPLYVNGKRVGMWMRWKDPDGMDIIDTRMHFTCGEHMLTGLEENTDRGLILAIQVDPYYRE